MTEQPDWNEMIIADEAKQKKAKRRSCCLAVFVTPLCLILVLLGGLSVYDDYFKFYFLQGDEVLGVYPSPTGDYTVTTYLLPEDDATRRERVLGVLTNQRTGRSKNIYLGYHGFSASVYWQDEVTVVIKNRTLDVRTDIYDYGFK